MVKVKLDIIFSIYSFCFFIIGIASVSSLVFITPPSSPLLKSSKSSTSVVLISTPHTLQIKAPSISVP